MQIDMRPAFRLLVAEHRDMVRGNLGPLDRAADDMLARLARLDDEDLTGSLSASLPVDAGEDGTDSLGAEG